MSTVPGDEPNRVRELREERLMSQRALAEEAGVAVRTIHSVEKGKRCRRDVKRRILSALGIPFDRWREVWPEP